jgi:CubicO group peptidase (beta-lactamase class C family)
MPQEIRLGRRQFLTRCTAGAALALAGGPVAQTAQTAPQSDYGGLLTAIPEVMKRLGVPGLQIAVIRDGQIALFESFGVMKLGADSPVTAETVFEAASLTKPVFAYVVMKLVEEGVLDLDAPLDDIVKAPAAGPPERVRELTARLVLSHRTGFPNWYQGKGQPNLRPSQGRLFAYSGMAYEYLQRVVEKLTQTPLNTLLRERILKPLSIEHATTSPDEVVAANLADGHTPDGKPTRARMLQANAASTLVCNARDYARFAAIVARPPAPSDVFLRPETLEEIFTPYIEAGPDIQWGLGWGLQMGPAGPESYFHWGDNYGAYHSFVVVNPRTGEGVVVMTNSGNGLRACAEIVPAAVSGDHPALRWNRVVRD